MLLNNYKTVLKKKFNYVSDLSIRTTPYGTILEIKGRDLDWKFIRKIYSIPKSEHLFNMIRSADIDDNLLALSIIINSSNDDEI